MEQITAPAPNRTLKKFDKASAKVKQVVAKLNTITLIQSKEESDKAIVVMKDAKDIEKMIESKRVELVSPHNDIVKEINNYAKGLMTQISTGIESGKKAVLSFQKEEESKALKLKIEARENQIRSLGMVEADNEFAYESVKIYKVTVREIVDANWLETIENLTNDINNLKLKALAALNADKDFLDAFGSDEDKVAIEEQITQASARVTVHDSIPIATEPTKLKGQTKNWKFSITDAYLIPREYLMVDEVKIRAAIAKGERSIAGVNIFQEDSLSLR